MRLFADSTEKCRSPSDPVNIASPGFKGRLRSLGSGSQTGTIAYSHISERMHVQGVGRLETPEAPEKFGGRVSHGQETRYESGPTSSNSTTDERARSRRGRQQILREAVKYLVFKHGHLLVPTSIREEGSRDLGDGS